MDVYIKYSARLNGQTCVLVFVCVFEFVYSANWFIFREIFNAYRGYTANAIQINFLYTARIFTVILPLINQFVFIYSMLKIAFFRFKTMTYLKYHNFDYHFIKHATNAVLLPKLHAIN